MTKLTERMFLRIFKRLLEAAGKERMFQTGALLSTKSTNYGAKPGQSRQGTIVWTDPRDGVSENDPGPAGIGVKWNDNGDEETVVAVDLPWFQIDG